MERTYLMIKPDGVQRNLIGEIVSRFERKGFTLVAAKLMTVTEEQLKPIMLSIRSVLFFGELVQFITSGPVFAMVWEGENVIATARKMMGATNPLDADPGTIRGDFGVQVGMNIIHGSDSVESSKREISIFFNDDELNHYDKAINEWV